MAIDSAGKKHALNYTLSDVEGKIDPSKFFRINRSEIINLDFLEKVEPYFKNKLAITQYFFVLEKNFSSQAPENLHE